MIGKDADNLRTGRVALALAVLATGAAGGFALRTATGEPARNSATDARISGIPSRSAALPASSAAARERPLRSRSHARPPEAVTLSAEQWAKVVAEPDRYALSLQKLRNGSWGISPVILSHAELFGWNEAIREDVAGALTAFNQELIELEKEKSDITYTTDPSDAGVGLVTISYSRLSEDASALVLDLEKDLRNILGPKDAARFAAIAHLSDLLNHRNASIREELRVRLLDDGQVSIGQTVTDGFSTRGVSLILPWKASQPATSPYTSAAVDWDRVLSSIQPMAPASE